MFSAYPSTTETAVAIKPTTPDANNLCVRRQQGWGQLLLTASDGGVVDRAVACLLCARPLFGVCVCMLVDRLRKSFPVCVKVSDEKKVCAVPRTYSCLRGCTVYFDRLHSSLLAFLIRSRCSAVSEGDPSVVLFTILVKDNKVGALETLLLLVFFRQASPFRRSIV